MSPEKIVRNQAPLPDVTDGTGLGHATQAMPSARSCRWCLEGEKPVVGQLGRVRVPINAKDAAVVFWIVHRTTFKAKLNRRARRPPQG